VPIGCQIYLLFSKVNSKFIYFYIGKGREEAVSFRQVLASFPNDCTAAGTINDISPHLCFICLLHLANEHGLSIHGCTNLDDLSIHFPHNGTCTSQ
jgi:condensin complex subunit 2